MKIALVSPAGAMHRFNGSFSLALHYAPLTFTTLAGLVPEELAAEIVIYDETVEPIPADLQADIIGITCITGTALRSYRWADYFRSRGIAVVLGGVHPSMLPQEAGQHADAVVVGFAEQTWPQLLRDFAAGQMQKLYRQPADFQFADTPYPRRDLIRKKKFVTHNTVEAVRGCVHCCDFCAYPAAFGPKVYTKPIERLIEEISRLPGKEVLFPDINLTAIPEYAKQMCRRLVPLKKYWFGLATAEIGQDQELLDLLAASGCKGLLIGFESVCDSSLNSFRKGFSTVEDYHRLIDELHRRGIAINGTFAFGADNEDDSVFERTVEMVIELKIDLPRFSLLTPFPRTRLYHDLQAQERIIESDWGMYDVEHCVFKPKRFSVNQLEQGLVWAWQKAYSLTAIFKRIGLHRPLYPFLLAANLGYRGYARKIERYGKDKMTDNSDVPEGNR